MGRVWAKQTCVSSRENSERMTIQALYSATCWDCSGPQGASIALLPAQISGSSANEAATTTTAAAATGVKGCCIRLRRGVRIHASLLFLCRP